MSYGIKPFIVIKKIGDYNGTVVREFEYRDDAESFASLLKRSEPKEFVNYYIAEVHMPNDVDSSPST